MLKSHLCFNHLESTAVLLLKPDWFFKSTLNLLCRRQYTKEEQKEAEEELKEALKDALPEPEPTPSASKVGQRCKLDPGFETTRFQTLMVEKA